MFCKNCGKELRDEWVKCPYCGTEKENFTPNQMNRIKHRQFWKYVILSIVTCGIYGIYVLYGFTEDMNKACEGDGKESKNYIIVFLLSFVTCGIYGLYWWYTQGERLHNAAPRYGMDVREKGSTILLWMILGCTVMPGIGMLVAIYIMFDNMNRVAMVYNGEISSSDLSGMEKPHPHLLRNVLIVYGVWLVVMILACVMFFGAIFTDDFSEEEISQTVEGTMDYSDMDMEEFIGRPGESLREMDFVEDDEGIGYMLPGSSVFVGCFEDDVSYVTIKSDKENTPNFHGVEIGMDLGTADALMKDVYKEVEKTEDKIEYINLDTGIDVELGINDQIIVEIFAVQLPEDELQEYMQADAEQQNAAQNYIFPDSDKKYLSEDEVRRVEADKLVIGRNEIFARHGRIFNDAGLAAYFEEQPWYQGTIPAEEFDADAQFNDFEKKNVELIKRIEDEISGASSQPFIGISGSYQSGSSLDSGVIDIYTDGTIFNMAIGTHRQVDILGGVGGGMPGRIVDSRTAVVEGDCTFTLTWSDAGIFTITREGSTGLAEVDAVTDGVEYVEASYYHVS